MQNILTLFFLTFTLNIINILSELRHCMCAHVHADALVYVFTHGGQRLTLECLPLLFSSLLVFLEKGLPRESELYCIGQAEWPVNLSSHLPSWHWSYRHMPPYPTFTWVLRANPQTPVLTQQTLNQHSYFPSLVNFSFLRQGLAIRLALNSLSSCLDLLSAGIADIYYLTMTGKNLFFKVIGQT